MPATPVTPDRLAELLAGALGRQAPGQWLRVGVDGPDWAGPDLAGAVAGRLPGLGRAADVVRAGDFLRAASLRFERGRDDADAYYESWYDWPALRREVLRPLRPGGSGRYLPTLWDPVADRATRAGYLAAAPGTVLLLAGPFLLRLADDLDLLVHVLLSPAARARRVPADAAARELPAFDRYAAEERPAGRADVVVHADDPRRPAVDDRTGLLSAAEPG